MCRRLVLSVIIFSLSGLAEAVSFPDSNTVGLWLFDEADYPHTTLTDASDYEKADLCLMDGGSMAAGKYGNALSISGGGYAVCYAGFAGKVPEEELREEDGTPSGLWGPTEGSGPLLNGLAGNTWTVELWLNLSSIGSGISIIDLGWAYDPGFSLTLSPGTFVLVSNYAGVQATCPTGLSTGAWHHVAFTRDGSTVRHFVDGVEQAAPTVSSVSVQPTPDLQVPADREHESRGFESMSYEERRQNRFNFAVGTDRHASNSASGMIDEMRISDVVRYSSNFTAECFSRNYGPGALEPSVADGPTLLFDPGPVSIPLQFGARKHVFIDDSIIDTKSNLQMTMNQPYGKEAIIKDFSIEKSAWRPSVFDVNGVVYLAMPEGYGSTTGTTYLATSPDGLNFTMQEPIIIESPLYGSFFKDLNPNVNPEEQYKVNAFVANRGMYFYGSADGVNWRRNETIQLALRSGGEGECFWDDQRGRYASYLKRDSSFDDPECADASGRVATGFWSDEILKAWPFYVMDTPYFEGYPFPSVTCEGPVEFYATGAGQVYRTRAIKYPWAPDVYLSFLWRYPGDDGPRHVDLGISRDGENWSFFGTNWYIPLGSEDEELSLYGLIRRGGEIWQYVDEGGAHGGSDPRYYYRYKQRLDGFVSLDAGGSTGTATTLPLVFEGRKLVLNIAATGSARVAILDEGGTAIPGFDLTDCDTIQADSVEHVVKWNGSSNVSGLEGTAVRLRFEMQNTKLYAFEFTSLVGAELASDPHPADGANDVEWNVVLSWSPGEGAGSHDVYLGTDFNDVSNADDSNHPNVDYNNVDVNSFDPGFLELGKTYYWRIDEVNDSNIFEGDVWSFTVSEYIVLDHMEAYNDDTRIITDTWRAESYPDANNGARVYLEDTIVHGGQKSMEFMFNVDWGTYFTATRTYSTAQDWTTAGVHHLSLWFRGYEYNLADDHIYVMLKDGTGHSATKPYDGDPNNIALQEWQEWNIRLQDFNDAGVNLGDVREIVLGAESLYWIGILYFDDIRLYLPRCIPDFRPAGDVTGDCSVDFRDVAVLGGQWLDSPGSPSADIAPDPLDDFVDMYDLAVVVDDWLEGLVYP